MKYNAKLVILLFLLAGQHVFGQQYRYSQVPVLLLDDFKEAPEQRGLKNALAYTSWYVFYDVKGKKQISDNKMYVSYKTRVVMRKKISWLDKKVLSRDKKKLASILEHERGHLLIAYIVANQLQIRMSKIYSGAYSKEARTIANHTFAEFRKFENNYDRETNHSNNHKEQMVWNKKLLSMFPN